MTTGTTTSPPAKAKRLPARSSATNTFGPLCRVKFAYKENPSQPIQNRYVAYWLYDSTGSKIDTAPQMKTFWNDQSILFPVSIGKTDDNGVLRSNLPDNVRFSLSKENGGCSIKSERYGQPANTGSTLALEFDIGFPMNRKVGFVLCPVDILKSVSTGDLLKLKTTDHAVTAQITSDEQVVQLQCSLPDWQYRIEQATNDLKRKSENYGKYIQRHLEAISQLDMLSSIMWCMGRFPADRIKAAQFDSACAMSSKLAKLKETILNRYIKKTSTSSGGCQNLLNRINTSANNLLSIIINKDFIAEYKRYLPRMLDAECKGPSFQNEDDWRSIFSALTNAYAELSKTGLADKVFDVHVAPWLTQIAHLGVEGAAEWPEHAAPPDSKDTPLLVMIDKYTSIIQSVANPAPGPVTLVEGLVDVFGLAISKWMNSLPRAQAKLPRDLMFGVMRIFNGGKSLDRVQRSVLAKAAYAGKLADGRNALNDFAREYLEKSHGELTGKLFCRAMFLFSLISLYNAVGSDEKDTLKKWMAITSAGTNAGATLMQTFFAQHLETEIKFGVKIGVKVETVAGSLAAIGGLAAAWLSYNDAEEAYAHHDLTRTRLFVGSMVGSILLSAGYFLMIFGASTSWAGGLGIVIAAFGAVISVGASVASLVIDLVEEGTKQTFKQIMDDFSKEKSTFEIVYKKDQRASQIPTLIDEILQLSGDMSWWDLSWRAIVPLYSRGFMLYQGGTNGEVSYGETSKMISKLINGSTLSTKGITYRSDYGKEFLVLDYINNFLLAQKDNKDFDNNGIPDAVEWLNGTIYPERHPGIYDPNPYWSAAS